MLWTWSGLCQDWILEPTYSGSAVYYAITTLSTEDNAVAGGEDYANKTLADALVYADLRYTQQEKLESNCPATCAVTYGRTYKTIQLN